MKIEFYYKDTGLPVKFQGDLVLTGEGDVFEIEWEGHGYQFSTNDNVAWRIVE